MKATRQLPAVPDFATTLVSTHFYPTRSVVVGRAMLTGEPRFRCAGAPVRVLERSGSSRAGANLRILVESTDLPGYAWLNASDIEETRS